MARLSVLQWLGLPSAFGGLLLAFGLVLSVGGWLSNHDFGLFKVPDFTAGAQKRLRIVGPLFLLVAVGIHVPLIAVSDTSQLDLRDTTNQAENRVQHDECTEKRGTLEQPFRCLFDRSPQ